MITTVDKAVQDFIISGIAIAGFMGFDFSTWQGILVPLAGALVKAFVTYMIPNRPA